ncbi:MAG: tRNA lysidine(34) synthetase TilS [Pseudomonadales bacterium]
MNPLDLKSDSALLDLFRPWLAAPRWLVGYSGGLDSSVLLQLCVHALRAHRATGAAAPLLQAVHVDHGLSPQHANWAEHCAAVCKALSVPLKIESLQISNTGGGLEQAARDARYALFEAALAKGDVLMLGHHEDDQGETLLYRLMRGCGVRGASAIPRQRALGTALVARPLLDLPRQTLQEYATAHAIECIEDESNADTRFDRNFLRHEVLPLLQARWPRANRSLARFAGHAREQGLLARDLASLDLATALHSDSRFGQSLSIAVITALPEHRRFNLYQHCLALLGLDPRGRLRIEEIDTLVRGGQSSAQFPLGSYSLRLHQDQLFFIAEHELVSLPRIRQPFVWQFEPLQDRTAGELLLQRGCNSEVQQKGLREQAYLLGQRLPEAQARINGQGKSLKRLLQELGIPAWLRDVTPVIYALPEAMQEKATVAQKSAHDLPGARGPLNASGALNAGGPLNARGPLKVAAIPGFVVCDEFAESGGRQLAWHCTAPNALHIALRDS